MENIKVAVGTIGVFVTAISLFGLLFPNGNIKKAGETGMTILTLFLLITPFLQAEFAESRILPERAAYDLYTFSESDVYQKALEQLIQNTLSQAGVQTESVTANIQNGENEEILLENLQITVSKETDEAYLKQILYDNLEIPSEIVQVTGE